MKKKLTYKTMLAILINCIIITVSLDHTQAQNCTELYGVTSRGGYESWGSIFLLDPDSMDMGMEYSYIHYGDGCYPVGELTISEKGKLLGMTTKGGQRNAGTIFQWDPTTLKATKLCEFGQGDYWSYTGSNPRGRLTYCNSLYYGITYGQIVNGPSGCIGGMGIFSFDPLNDSISRVHNFDPICLYPPKGNLTCYLDKLYGLRSLSYQSSIYMYDPVTNSYSDIELFLHNCRFTGTMIVHDSVLYGYVEAFLLPNPTNYGGIFKFNPSTNEFFVVATLSNIIGGKPSGTLTEYNGLFYGLCPNGGTNAAGIIFSFNPATGEIVKEYEFIGSVNGSKPVESLIVNNGLLYGITEAGGNEGCGVAFSWNPNTENYTKISDFNAISDGCSPEGSLIILDGHFYGLCQYGGQLNKGTLYSFNTDSNILTKRHEFSQPINDIGRYPFAGLTQFQFKLYGVTNKGGENDGGTLFCWDPISHAYDKLFDCDRYIWDIDPPPYNVSYPTDLLTLSHNKLYGVSFFGGALGGNIGGGGLIFEWDPQNNQYSNKFYFDGDTSGCRPVGSLTELDNKLFGCTNYGGQFDDGVIYSFDPETGNFSKLLDFKNDSTGWAPNGTLLGFQDHLWGMTVAGGIYDEGVLFEFDPLTRLYIKHKDFQRPLDGGYPLGSLIEFNNKLYSMTSRGGLHDAGTLFEWDIQNNLFTKLLDFDSLVTGAHPDGRLTEYQGKLYGMTPYGGINNYGTVFKFDPIQNNIMVQFFDGTNGSRPLNSVFTVYEFPASDVTWTGGEDSDWFKPANWSPCSPNEPSNVIIPGNVANPPTLLQCDSINSITFEDGASFIGSEFLKTGNATYYRNFQNDSCYHFLASPVSSTNFGQVFPLEERNVWAYLYDESSGNWINQVYSDHLTPAKGYSIRMDEVQPAVFTGKLNQNEIATELHLQNPSSDPNRRGWNLIGNPFTSAIAWDSIFKGNFIDGAVYVWNGNNYLTYVAGIGNLINGIIPATNGFFVRTGVNNESISIPLKARVHEDQVFYKQESNSAIRIGIEGSRFQDEIFIRFNDECTFGFDRDFDALKLKGIPEAPQLFIESENSLFSIQSLPFFKDLKVNLGFLAGEDSYYKLSLRESSASIDTIPILIDDKITGLTQDLRINPVYDFTSTKQDIENRFIIRFSSIDDITPHIQRITINQSQKGKVIIHNPDNFNGDVYIINMLGQVVSVFPLPAQNVFYPEFNLSDGLYIILIKTENSTISKKVILHN